MNVVIQNAQGRWIPGLSYHEGHEEHEGNHMKSNYFPSWPSWWKCPCG